MQSVRACRRPIYHIRKEIHRTVYHIDIRNEFNKLSVCKIIVARNNHPTAHTERNEISEIQNESKRGIDVVIEYREIFLILCRLTVCAVEAVGFRLLARERLDDSHSLKNVGELRIESARAGISFGVQLHFFAVAFQYHKEEKRYGKERADRQKRIFNKEYNAYYNDLNDVYKEIRDAVAEK